MKTSKARLWISYILQGIIVIMFLMGAVMNILQTEQAIAGATDLGYQELFYAFPKPSGFGAVLLTAWLGGAVATHVIHQDPLFDTVFPVLFGIVMWLALWLRQEKVQKLFAF